MKSATTKNVKSKNLHVPLPGTLYEQLKGASLAADRPSTVLAREAIEEWLSRRARETRRREIALYAAAVAGTRDDLDPDLEAASLEHLNREWKRRR